MEKESFNINLQKVDDSSAENAKEYNNNLEFESESINE